MSAVKEKSGLAGKAISRRRLVAAVASLAVLVAVAVGIWQLFFVSDVTVVKKETRIEFSEEAICTPTSTGTSTSVDGKLVVRDVTLHCEHPASIPQLQGSEEIVLNGDFDATGSGPMWMTWTLSAAMGGGWEGTWSGQVTGFPAAISGSGNGIGRGTGIYEGQQYFSSTTLTPERTMATGYILTP